VKAKRTFAAMTVAMILIAIVGFFLFYVELIQFGVSKNQSTPQSSQGATRAAAQNLPAARVASNTLASDVKPASRRANSHVLASQDDFVVAFASLVKRAEEGDLAAAWDISRLLHTCGLVIRAIRRGAPVDSVDGVLGSTHPAWSELKEKEQRNCAELARAPEYASWGHEKRGDKFFAPTWASRALEGKYPVAVADDMAKELWRIEDIQDPIARQTSLQQAQQKLRGLVQTRNPEVLYIVGMSLSDPRFSSRPERGFAMALASCSLGYDCSSENPVNPWHNCRYFGQCTDGQTLEQNMQSSMPPSYFAKVYGEYQELLELLTRGDWSVINEWVRLKDAGS
jgi:hypothetical protein